MVEWIKCKITVHCFDFPLIISRPLYDPAASIIEDIRSPTIRCLISIELATERINRFTLKNYAVCSRCENGVREAAPLHYLWP